MNKQHLYESNDGKIHACEGARMVVHDPGTYIIWTLCEIDVPPNCSFISTEKITCQDCPKRKENNVR